MPAAPSTEPLTSGVGWPRRRLRERWPDLAAAALAVAAFLVAMRWGSFVAGGSDSYCYVALARMWLDGSIFRPVSPGFSPDWTNGPLSLVPAGFIPSPVVAGGMAPICSPGLGLIMAGAEAVAGRGAAFVVVPLLGALAVWAAFLLGRRLGGPVAGVLAALLTLTSPIFLFQLVQPMSDVPAAALWVLSLAVAARRTTRSRLAAGLLVGGALGIRPNLLPMAAPLALLPFIDVHDRAAWPARAGAVVAFLIGTLPGISVMLWANQALYGSPLGSGYGDPSLLFRWEHVGANLARYPAWLVESHTPWVLLGVASPLLLARRSVTPPTEGHAPAAIATTGLLALLMSLLVYLPYAVFDSWSYLRFLLTGVEILIITSAVVTVRLIARLPRAVNVSAVIVMAALLAAVSVRTARERFAFDLKLSEGRFIEVGEWVRTRLPPSTVVLSVWQSGSIRMYGERFTVLWDAIEPRELDSIIERLRGAGRNPILLLDTWEVPRFKERFRAASVLSALDWPPKAQIGREVVVYDPADRSRYFSGGRVPTERVWTAAERAALGRR